MDSNDTPPPSSRRIGRAGRLVIRLSLALLVLAALALTLLITLFPADDLRPWAERELAQRLGVPVEIEELHLSMFEGLGLEAAGVRVGPAEPLAVGAEPWLVMESLLFRFDWRKLLFERELEVRALRMKGLDLLLERTETGWNWPFLNPSSQEPPRPVEPEAPVQAADGPRIAVDELLLEGIRLRLRTPAFSLETGPYNVSAQGAFAPGEELNMRLAMSKGPPTWLRIARGGGESRAKLESRLGGEVRIRVTDADRFESEGSISAGELLLARGARVLEPPELPALSWEAAGSLTGRTAEIARFDVDAGGAVQVAAGGDLAGQGTLPRARLTLKRARFDLGRLSQYAALFVEGLPRVEGLLALNDLAALFTGGSEEAVRLGGSIKLSEASLGLGPEALGVTGIALEAQLEGLTLRQSRLMAGGGSVHLGWSLLRHPAVGDLNGGQLRLKGQASGGALEWNLGAKAAAALSPGGLSYAGPLSVDADGRWDPALGRLGLSELSARAEGVLLAAHAELGWKGQQPPLSAEGKLTVESGPFAAAWLRSAGAPSLIEQSVLTGPVHVDLTLAGDPAGSMDLRAKLDAALSTERPEPLQIEKGRLGGDVRIGLAKGSLEKLSGRLDLEAHSAGYGGRGVGGLSASAKFSTAESQWLTSQLSGRVGRIWLDHGERERDPEESAPPFSFDLDVKSDLGGRGDSELGLALHWGAPLAAYLTVKNKPGQRYLDLSARSEGAWPLDTLVARLPRSLRAPLRDGRAEGRLSWKVAARGTLPERFEPEMDLPLDVWGEAKWSGVSFGLLEPDLSIEGAQGEVRVGPPAEGEGLEAGGSLHLARSQLSALREEPLGPTIVSFRARAERLDEIRLEELLLYSDAFKTSLRVSATARPLARPPTLRMQAELSAGAPVRWRLRPGLDLAGLLGATLVGERQGSGPLVVRGELSAQGLGLWKGEGLSIEGLSGRIPVATAFALGGGFALMDPPAAAQASAPGALQSLLSGELARLAPEQHGRGLVLDRLRSGRLSLDRLAADAKLQGAELALERLAAGFLDGTLTGKARVRLGRPILAGLSLAARGLDARYLIPAERLGARARQATKAYLVNADINMTAQYPPPDVDGEIQVTRLGREVLFAILDGLDPDQTNPSITNIRNKMDSYLFLRPKAVVFRAQHGVANLDVLTEANPSGLGQLLLLGGYALAVGTFDFIVPRIPLQKLLEVMVP